MLKNVTWLSCHLCTLLPDNGFCDYEQSHIELSNGSYWVSWGETEAGSYSKSPCQFGDNLYGLCGLQVFPDEKGTYVRQIGGSLDIYCFVRQDYCGHVVWQKLEGMYLLLPLNVLNIPTFG